MTPQKETSRREQCGTVAALQGNRRWGRVSPGAKLPDSRRLASATALIDSLGIALALARWGLERVSAVANRQTLTANQPRL